ncbi:hypothetical protein PGS_00014320 [Porphyromonas gingivalis A7A1-28]|nr:hypothetical protein PGS_00014320 [Porphyromonas gingivalis A7A1-28]
MWKIKHTNNQCVVPFLYIELTLTSDCDVAWYLLGDHSVTSFRMIAKRQKRHSQTYRPVR